MSQPIKGTAVRLPLDLHTLISDAAVENNRSRHAEMLHRLEASFNEPVAELDPDARGKIEARIENVFTTCFTQLEERVAALLEHPLYSITIPEQEMSEEDIKALRTSLKTRGMYAELSRLNGDIGHQPFDLRSGKGQGFDFLGQPGTSSPTGRLSDTDPELQDLPAVSGMSTLAASVDRLGVCPECGTVTKLDRYHSGGFTGWPKGELPKILERGELVIPASECKWQPARGERPQPFTGQNWVLTGSLETMTRDRAREIIMDLGGGVAGAVDGKTHALVWGPGAGSKKTRAEQLGVQQYTERQFIELIRSHGVDMPLPKAEELPEGEWIENTGVEPEGVTNKSILDFKLSTGNPVLGHHYLQGSSKGKAIWSIEGRKSHVTHWRHSAYNRQQTFAENVTSTPPKSPDQAVAEQLS